MNDWVLHRIKCWRVKCEDKEQENINPSLKKHGGSILGLIMGEKKTNNTSTHPKG